MFFIKLIFEEPKIFKLLFSKSEDVKIIVNIKINIKHLLIGLNFIFSFNISFCVNRSNFVKNDLDPIDYFVQFNVRDANEKIYFPKLSILQIR